MDRRTYAGTVLFDHVVREASELRALYRPPGGLAADKDRPTIDEASRAFIERSTFVVVGTVGEDGADVSPKGGPSGFARVLDPTCLAIADYSGNNRLDGMHNLLGDARVGLLFVVPGRSETVRVNGTASITTDAQVLGGFPSTTRAPKAAIAVNVASTFVHCAKAFKRGGMWDPEHWAALADAPDAAEILVCQGVGDAGVDTVRADLATGYAASARADTGV